MVDAEDLDYVDDVPNPQEPDNERVLDTIILDEDEHEVQDLDDSDGLEQGATASNIAEIPSIPARNLSKQEWDELLKRNPSLKSLLSDLLDKKLKEVIPGGILKGSDFSKSKQVVKGVKNFKLNAKPATKSQLKSSERTIKLPSDTTIYALALKMNGSPVNLIRASGQLGGRSGVNEAEISQFLQSVRLSQENQDNSNGYNYVQNSVITGQQVQQSGREESQAEPSTSRGLVDNSEVIENAKRRTEKNMLEAEKFRAAIVEPPGIVINSPIGHGLCDQ